MAASRCHTPTLCRDFVSTSFSVLNPFLLAIPRVANRLAGCSPTHFLSPVYPTRLDVSQPPLGLGVTLHSCTWTHHNLSQLGTTFRLKLNSQHLKASMLFSFYLSEADKHIDLEGYTWRRWSRRTEQNEPGSLHHRSEQKLLAITVAPDKTTTSA